MIGAETRPWCSSITRVSISGDTDVTPGTAAILRASSSSPVTTSPGMREDMVACGLKSSIFFSHRSPNPVITARTTITAATPRRTPKTETQVITLVTLRFGLRYFRPRNRLNGIAEL